MRLLIITFLFAITLSSIHAQGYKPGDKAMDFSLKNVNGEMVSLKSVSEAKGYIVVFTCNHCPFAKMYEQRIIDLHQKYASKGYPVIAINPNDPTNNEEDSFENMKKRASEKSYPFPYLLDDTQQVAKAYGAQRTPHIYILRKVNNEYVVEFVGAIDDNAQDASRVKEKYVEKAIEELLQNKPVSTKSIKAIGCGIKWKS